VQFVPTANYCRKLNIENQSIMRHCDNYDTNLPNKKSLKQLKINGKRENKIPVPLKNDKFRHFENNESGLQQGVKISDILLLETSKLMGNKNARV
jgi:hypothetical protein